MKKFLFIAVALIGFTGKLQAQVTTAAPTGDFNNKSIDYPGVWYTDKDTVSNTANDTLKVKVGGWRNSIVFTTEIKNHSGNDSQSVVQIWATARNSKYSGYVLLKEEILVNTTNLQLFKYVVTGNPYTDYWILFDGAGTHATAIQSWITPK